MIDNVPKQKIPDQAGDLTGWNAKVVRVRVGFPGIAPYFAGAKHPLINPCKNQAGRGRYFALTLAFCAILP